MKVDVIHVLVRRVVDVLARVHVLVHVLRETRDFQVTIVSLDIQKGHRHR